jgi:F-type H+-transporting ATPase subunit b
MESIISTFHIDWKIIIAQAVNFAFVFIVLYLFALKPLKKTMDERSNKIAQGLEDAKTNSLTLERSKKEYEEIMVRARSEAQKFFDDTKKEAMAKKESMLSDAKTEVANIIENGRKTLEADKAKMVNDAKNELASLAVQAAEKVMAERNK